jgi:RimJ/RimL family protein N-acetyltransferase
METATRYLLRTPRLGLRRWKPSDLEVFTLMNQDPRVMEFFPRVLTAAESAAMAAKNDAFFEQYGYGLYAVDELVPVSAGTATEEFIGYVGLLRPSFESWFTPCVEVGWRLRAEVWGCGYATEAAAACLAYGLGELGMERIYSFTAVPNVRSERVMLKIGMKKVGEFDHPRIEEGSWLRRHALYVAERGR